MKICEILNEGPDLNNPREVKEWIDRYKRIIATSDFQGERDAAQNFLNKFLAKINRKPEPEPKREKPKYEQPKTPAKDGDFKVVFFGRFQRPNLHSREAGSNKVWGWGVKGDVLFQFWGPYGKTPQTKQMPNNSTNRAKLNKLADTKERKGYRQIPASQNKEWLRSVLSKDPKFSEIF